MRYFWLLILCFLASCQALPQKETKKSFRSIEVRVTTYWKNSDHWTRQGLTSTGGRLEHMKTCAVDPEIIPYGSTVILETNPPLKLTPNDRGTAVIERKASKKMGRDNPVVDVFFETKSSAKFFIRNNPYFVMAKVYD